MEEGGDPLDRSLIIKKIKKDVENHTVPHHQVRQLSAIKAKERSQNEKDKNLQYRNKVQGQAF